MPGLGGEMHHRGGAGAGPPGNSGGFEMPTIPLSPKSLARVGLGAYGDKFLGAGTAFVSNNYAKYFSSKKTQAYFDVTEAYAFAKMKLILCPFLHRGSWARVPAGAGGRGVGYGGAGGNSYGGQSQNNPYGDSMNPGLNGSSPRLFKPPKDDINAPDLYLPLMGFWSYVLAASALQAKNETFTPESVATHFSWGGAVWFFESLLVWVALRRFVLRVSQIPPTVCPCRTDTFFFFTSSNFFYPS